MLDSNLTHKLKESYQLDGLDPNTDVLVDSLQHGQHIEHFALQDGLLRRKGKLVIGPDDELKLAILQWLHNSS